MYCAFRSYLILARKIEWGTKSRGETGGETGIRTLGRVSPTHAFQACSFNHSDISPFRISYLRAVGNSVAQNHPSSSAGPQMDCLQLFAELCPAIVSGIVSDLQMSLDHLRRFGRAARRIVERPTIGRDDSRRQYIHCSLVWTAFVTPLIPVRLRSMKP